MSTADIAGTLLQALAGHRVVDLAHPLDERIPFSPNAPGFRRTLLRRHGDVVLDDEVSFATDLVVTGTHVGTHIDALAHISHRDRLHGGAQASTEQIGGGFDHGDAARLPILVGRGVLLDVAASEGVEVVPADTAIGAAELAAAATWGGVQVRSGDIVLIRTGWSAYVGDRARFVGMADGAPGVDEGGAEWLVEHEICAVGGETIAFEHIPAGRGHQHMPVHRRLLVEAGIPIIEVMRLDDLAGGPSTFGFVLAPLRLTGATGSPTRPFALVPMS